MAKRKSVTISAKPSPAAEVVPGGSTAVTADWVPAQGPKTGEAASLGLMGRTVYGAVWALSFGCVFGALVVARILPGRALLARGLSDGAHAAMEAVRFLPRIGDQERESGLSA